MNEHANDRLIRAHEQRMTGIEEWCIKLEKKIDKIPWILLVVVVNICLSLIQLVLKK
jgi:hypothetical protein